ncbi:hypothetical protein C2G38_2228121 [Gigaspora rosea]|uniref:Uncharacterized protein n=1 Tax=Gigaspora rosea TaxID=44941 RepID=A0A397TZH3_9GLOM|nr:hypothetical protein C2G38_2228121 [Gigaspora rosea]
MASMLIQLMMVVLYPYKNHYKYIHALLPNGSIIDINLNVLDKTITQYYFLLYDGNMQITGIVLDYNKRIQNGTISKIKKLDLKIDTRLSSFLIYNINKVNDTLYLFPITGKFSENSLLYHARNISKISNISCSSDYIEYGNVCVITEPTDTFVTSSILNQWNATYVIVMDNNLVMFSSTNEPMYDIEEYRWKFTIIPCTQSNQKYAEDTAVGTIWLTLGDDIKNDSTSNILNN